MTETRVNVEHYNTGTIETIDYIADVLGPEAFRAYVLGNIIKYASRALHKGQFASDIEKIRNYAVILQEIEHRNDQSVEKEIEDYFEELSKQIGQLFDESPLWGETKPEPEEPLSQWEQDLLASARRLQPGDRVFVADNAKYEEFDGDDYVDPVFFEQVVTVSRYESDGSVQVELNNSETNWISEKYLARVWDCTDDIPDGVDKVIDDEGSPLFRIGSSRGWSYCGFTEDEVPDLDGFTARYEHAPYLEAL